VSEDKARYQWCVCVLPLADMRKRLLHGTGRTLEDIQTRASKLR